MCPPPKFLQLLILPPQGHMFRLNPDYLVNTPHTQSYSSPWVSGGFHCEGPTQAAEGQEHEDSSRLLQSPHCPGHCPSRSSG